MTIESVVWQVLVGTWTSNKVLAYNI